MGLNDKHLTYNKANNVVGQYGFYGYLATILTGVKLRSILLPDIHKTPYYPHHRSIYV